MRVAVTGSTGLIGSALASSLRTAGDDVVRLVRGTPVSPDEVAWDPIGGTVDIEGLTGVDAVVHLAGAGVGDHRWTHEYKRKIRDSRVLGTRTLVKAITSLDPLPRVLISGSAIGYYGERGDEVLTEKSGPGAGFLVDVVKDWEAEATPAADAGIRVVHPRTGLVMARSGGAFAQLLLLAKLGLAGPLGNGRQWWSWITLPDLVAALQFLLEAEVSGPVNMTAPEPEHNKVVIAAIAKAMHRPSLIPAPGIALRLVLGEFAGQVLASQRVLPDSLVKAGYTFQHSTIGDAAAWVTT